MIKAVIFDLDGVVVNSEPLYQKAQTRLFAEFDLIIPESDWLLFRGLTEEAYYELVCRRYGLESTPAELQRRGRAYVEEIFKAELEVMDGFARLHQRLKGHYRLGLVTSTGTDLYWLVADKLQFEGLFQEVVCGDMTANHKPHPEPYLEMMRRLGVTPKESVVVEDSIHGLQAACDAGAWTIALTGSAPPEKMPPVHAIIDSLGELSPGYIDNLVMMVEV
ncbi:MAG: HAD family phosphatase [Candidatus Neomarinimicrobiota bacterium]